MNSFFFTKKNPLRHYVFARKKITIHGLDIARDFLYNLHSWHAPVCSSPTLKFTIALELCALCSKDREKIVKLAHLMQQNCSRFCSKNVDSENGRHESCSFQIVREQELDEEIDSLFYYRLRRMKIQNIIQHIVF